MRIFHQVIIEYVRTMVCILHYIYILYNSLVYRLYSLDTKSIFGMKLYCIDRIWDIEYSLLVVSAAVYCHTNVDLIF